MGNQIELHQLVRWISH